MLWGRTPTNMSNTFMQEFERRRQMQENAQSIQAMFKALGIPIPQGNMNPQDARMVAGATMDANSAQAARANQIADRDEQRLYDEKKRDEQRLYNEKQRDEGRAYKESQETKGELVGTDYDIQSVEDEINDIYSSLAGYPEERLKELETWIDSPDVQAKLRAIQNYDPKKSEQIRQMYSNALAWTRREARNRKIQQLTGENNQ